MAAFGGHYYFRQTVCALLVARTIRPIGNAAFNYHIAGFLARMAGNANETLAVGTTAHPARKCVVNRNLSAAISASYMQCHTRQPLLSIHSPNSTVDAITLGRTGQTFARVACNGPDSPATMTPPATQSSQPIL